MKNPIPTNRLVAFTLAGAILTAAVAAGLAFPGLGFTLPTDTVNSAAEQDIASIDQVAEDTPEVNQDFTPDVKTESAYEEEEHEDEYEEEEEHEDEYEEEEEHEDEYEEEEGHEDEYEEEEEHEDDE
jgi:hypothetical protein